MANFNTEVLEYTSKYTRTVSINICTAHELVIKKILQTYSSTEIRDSIARIKCRACRVNGDELGREAEAVGMLWALNSRVNDI